MPYVTEFSGRALLYNVNIGCNGRINSLLLFLGVIFFRSFGSMFDLSPMRGKLACVEKRCVIDSIMDQSTFCRLLSLIVVGLCMQQRT